MIKLLAGAVLLFGGVYFGFVGFAEHNLGQVGAAACMVIAGAAIVGTEISK